MKLIGIGLNAAMLAYNLAHKDKTSLGILVSALNIVAIFRFITY